VLTVFGRGEESRTHIMFELRILSEGLHSSVPLAHGTRWRIGRDIACEIQVTDKRVSGEHAELLVDGKTVKVRCFPGKRALDLHGAAVMEAELQSGTSFSIGHTEFTLVLNEDGLNLMDTQAVLSEAWKARSAATPPANATISATESGLQPAIGGAAGPMRLIAQLISLLSGAEDRSGLANSVLVYACQRLRATRALLARVQDSQSLELIATHGIPNDADARALISTTVLKHIVDHRQAVFIGNTQKSGTSIGQQISVVRNHIQAVACTPVFNSRGELAAVFYVDNQDRPSEFSAQEAELLVWLGQIYSLLDENLEMRRRLEAEVKELKSGANLKGEFVAEAPAMTQLLERARKAAASEAAVLILGESGVGKERVARLLHQQSSRADKRFFARNCAAIPETLFESEMFGHKKGAFTGADSDRKGAFAEADGGTLFLDEIGELSYSLQSKLLRAIQERLIRPVGSDKEIAVDVRIVCATNIDLREACRQKTFREDLFYRISTVTLQVPPLRERRDDIAPLARFFVNMLSGGTRTLTPGAEQLLLSYAWPGNVRELRAILEQACIFAAGNEITADELNLPTGPTGRIDLTPMSLAEVERRHILHVLQSVNGNKTEAAKQLCLARSTLVLKLQSYDEQAKGIQKPQA